MDKEVREEKQRTVLPWYLSQASIPEEAIHHLFWILRQDTWL